MDATQSASNFNLSNILSTLRIFLALIVPPMILTDNLWVRLASAVIFTIAGLTDYWDGMLARRHNWITTYGKIVDPIADKMLTLGAFISFSYLGIFPWWILVPILIREIGITVLRFYFLYKGVAVAAVKSGKQKTTLQFSAIGLMFLLMLYRGYMQPTLPESAGNIIGILLNVTMWIVLLAATYQTLYSGFDFLRMNWHLLTKRS